MYVLNRRFDGKTMKRIGGRSPTPSTSSKNNAIKMAVAWRSLGLNARVIPNAKGFNVYVGNPRKYNARKGFQDSRGREPKIIPARKFKKHKGFNFENQPIIYSNSVGIDSAASVLRSLEREELIGKEAMIQDLGLFGGVMGMSKEAKGGYFNFFDVRQLEDDSFVLVPPKISRFKNKDGLFEYRIERLGLATNANEELLELVNAKRIGISGERDEPRQYNKDLPTDEEVKEEISDMQFSFDDEIYDEMSWNASFGEGSDEAMAVFSGEADDEDILELYEDLNDEMWERRAEYLLESGFTEDGRGNMRAADKDGNIIADPLVYESAINIFGRTGNKRRNKNNIPILDGQKQLRRLVGNWVNIAAMMEQSTPRRKEAFDDKMQNILRKTHMMYANPYEKDFPNRNKKHFYNPRYDRWIVGFLTEYNNYLYFANKNYVDSTTQLQAEKFLEALVIAKNDTNAKDLPTYDIDALAVNMLKELSLGEQDGIDEIDYKMIIGYRDDFDPASKLNPTFWRNVSRRG